MGVARYIKDEKDAIRDVVYQSGIRIKPSYSPRDLEAVGFDYAKDLGDPGEYPFTRSLHPLGYHVMLRLNMDAGIMLTDSGGLQEECTVLGTPCLTLRWNTERPVTLREFGGASVLVGNNIEKIREEYRNTVCLNRRPERPELWDGKTASRCLQAILEYEEH